MRIIKKIIQKKISLFPKNVVYFGFFTHDMECERGKHDFSNKVMILMQQVSLYFNKNCQENEFQKILYK